MFECFLIVECFLYSRTQESMTIGGMEYNRKLNLLAI